VTRCDRGSRSHITSSIKFYGSPAKCAFTAAGIECFRARIRLARGFARIR
jgi:hypothetical protein